VYTHTQINVKHMLTKRPQYGAANLNLNKLQILFLSNELISKTVFSENSKYA